ncbi:MAG: GAF domain-containing protein [Methylococcales bacterium]
MNNGQPINIHRSVCNELHSILSSLKNEIKADVATLYVYDSKNGSFHLPVGIGLRDPDSFNDPIMRPRADRVAAKVTLGDSPLCIERIEEYPELFGAFANRERVRSFAGMPCLVGGQVVGVLFVNFRSQHSFSEQEVELCQGFAFRVGTAIVESSILQNLPEVSVKPASSQEKNLQGIVELAGSTTNSLMGIWLFDPKEKDRLCLRASTSFPKSYREKAYRTLDDDSIICKVFSTGNEQFIEDLQSDEHFYFKKIAKDAGWRSVFCCPITSRGKRVGVIESFTFYPWRHDQSLIMTHRQLADLIGVTLENSRRSEEAEQLAGLARKMTIEPDFKSILQSIVNTARELTDADSSSVFLYEKRTRQFTLGVRSPFQEDVKIELPRINGLTKHIINTGEIVHIRNSGDDKRSKKLKATERAKSLIGIRLDVGQEGVGVLYVRGKRIEQFVEADETLLTNITTQASLGFSGRFLLGPIGDIEDAAAKRFDKEKVLDYVCREIMDLGFRFAAIQLISQKDRIIETVYVKGAPIESDWSGVAKHSLDSEPAIRDIQADIALEDPPLVKIVTGWCEKFDRWIYDEFNHHAYTRVWVPIIVVRDDKGNVVNDWFNSWDGKVVSEGKVYDPNEDRSGYITRIKMSLPTVNPRQKVEIIGTIEAGYYASEADEQDLSEWIKCDQGIVLAKRAARFALDIHETMLPCVLETIADRAWEIIHADSASLHFLYNQEREKFSYEVCMGELSKEFLEEHQPRSNGLGQTAIREGRVKFVPDTAQGHAENALQEMNQPVWDVGVRAMAAVPLLMGEQTGVLYVLFRKPHRFTDVEIGWIQLFANRAVDAIRNSITYDLIRDNERALTALHTISKSLASKPQDEYLLRQIAGNATNVLAADTTTIVEYDGADKRFMMPPDIAGRLLYEPEKERIRELGQLTPPKLLLQHTDDVYTAEDCESDPIMNSPERVRTKKEFFIEREKIKSSAGIVLQVTKENHSDVRTKGINEIVGVMFVNFRHHHVFTEQEKKIIKTLATNAAIAIKNRRLLAVLTAGTREILTTLDSEELLGLIVKRAVKITGGDVGSIRILEGLASDELVAYAQYPEDEAINESQRCIKVGHGFIGKVAKEKVALIVYDTKDEPDRKPFFEGLRSCVYVPMLTGEGELLGVLASGSRKKSKFDEQDRVMLEALADQAVIALQNTEQQKQLSRVETMATLGDIAGNLSHQVNNKVGAIREFSKILKKQVKGEAQQTVEKVYELSEQILEWVNKLNNSIPKRVGGVDVKKALDTAIQNISFHENISVSRDLPPMLASVIGGESLLQSLFVNLFQNAVDAMPYGGTLHIKTQLLERDSKKFIEILIKDTGTGIPQEQIDKVFERYYTTKGEWHGFGLWWNKNYIERLEGTLTVQSELGKGSCFTILLPIWKNIDSS